MTNLKKLLAATVALTALGAGAAHAATSATPTAYIATPTTPASSTILVGSGSFVVDDATTATNGGWNTLFTSGNQITLTLSQGTFANTPTFTCAGCTTTFVSGGAGSSSVTVQLASVSAAPTVGNPAVNVLTASAIQVTGLTNTADSGSSTKNGVSIAVTTNGTALNSTSATNRTKQIATFENLFTVAVTGTTGPTADLALTSPGSAFSGSNSHGTFTITPKSLVTYSNAAVNVGVPSFTASIPFAAGTLTLADGGTCAPATFTTGSTPAVGASIAYTTTTAVPGGGCTSILTPSSVVGNTALIASGPASLGWSVASSNAPAGAVLSGTATLLPTTYVGGGAKTVQYVVGEDANYASYINVNTDVAGLVAFSAGRFSATVGPAMTANSTRLFSIAEIRTALLAAGAPSTLFANAGSRSPVTVITPSSNARVTPVILNKASAIVTEVGNIAN